MNHLFVFKPETPQVEVILVLSSPKLLSVSRGATVLPPQLRSTEQRATQQETEEAQRPSSLLLNQEKDAYKSNSKAKLSYKPLKTQPKERSK